MMHNVFGICQLAFTNALIHPGKGNSKATTSINGDPLVDVVPFLFYNEKVKQECYMDREGRQYL